jgi:hypothetical protein
VNAADVRAGMRVCVPARKVMVSGHHGCAFVPVADLTSEGGEAFSTTSSPPASLRVVKG